MTVAMAVYVFRYQLHDVQSLTSFVQQHKLDVQVARISLIFFPISGCVHVSRVNCVEVTRDRAKQRAHEIFSIKRRFQQPTS